MSEVVIALIIALAFATWFYAKLMRSSGGNTQSSFTAAVIAAGVSFLLIMIILHFVLSFLP